MKPDGKTNSHQPDAARIEGPKRRALGKGLESLLSSRPAAGKPEAPTPRPEDANGATAGPHVAPQMHPASDPGGTPREIPLDHIEKNPYQTRSAINEGQLEELAKSIQANGVIQPIIVRPIANGRFQLIAGERRLRASEKLGSPTIPAIVRQVSDGQAMEMTIVENLQRADLNPMEQARAYERLGREFHMTQEQMAVRTGKDRASVANFLRLLRLPAEVQANIEAGRLSFGHGKALLALDSADVMAKVTARIEAHSMSVRQTEEYVQAILNPEKRAVGEQKEKHVDANVRSIQEQLQRELGLKVRITDRNGRGKVVIEYSRLEDFDAILKGLRVG